MRRSVRSRAGRQSSKTSYNTLLGDHRAGCRWPGSRHMMGEPPCSNVVLEAFETTVS